MKITLKESIFLFFVLLLIGFTSWFYIHFDQSEPTHPLKSQTAPTQFAYHIIWTTYHRNTGQISHSIASPYWAYYSPNQKHTLKEPKITLYPTVKEKNK